MVIIKQFYYILIENTDMCFALYIGKNLRIRNTSHPNELMFLYNNILQRLYCHVILDNVPIIYDAWSF